ncbi:hypothetical protein BURK2_02625 [Burkholderiales bacterium]|nr:MAG: type IV pilus modification protein PilV [Burkholderiales bacterium]CAG0995144.1 hypothetical protein BURK2_02625 [Burkholderiales bacterium]
MPNQLARLPTRGTSRQSGFSLLEALVSIVILSIGLLGVAALQTVGLRANSSAAYRSQAAWLATQMLEEARSQRPAVIAGNGSVIGATASVPCASAAVTPINRWRARIACALPEGQGGLDYNAITQRLTVTVVWNDSRGTDNATTGGAASANFTMESAL